MFSVGLRIAARFPGPLSSRCEGRLLPRLRPESGKASFPPPNARDIRKPRRAERFVEKEETGFRVQLPFGLPR